MTRMLGHAPVILSLALVITGALPVAAQTRVEAGSIRRNARADTLDASERQLRRLQLALDSLTQVYHEDDELTVAERRRVGEALERTAMRLAALSGRTSPDVRVRATGIGTMSVRVAPMMPEQASAQMTRALTQMKADSVAMPRGWIGIVAQGSGLEPRILNGELIIRYLTYPRVVSVDPYSPAQRAGISPDDTLLAYNGRDVRENDISLTKLLRPNTRVSVRILRDNRVRDFSVTVAPVPSRVELRRDDEIREARASWVTAANAFDGVASVRRVTTRPGVARSAPTVPPMQMLSALNLSFANGVGGAHLLTITDGLGRTLGVRHGVLVTAAPVGSPANESGLVDGDVILKVAGQAVRTVQQVRELVAVVVENGGQAVELETLRERRTRRVMLRW